MRRYVVLIGFLAFLIGLTVWITSTKERIGVLFPASWSDLQIYSWEHFEMVLVSELIAIAIAVPLGILVTREGFKKLATPVIGMGNIGQAMPSLAVIALIFPIFGFSFQTAIIALFIYSLLPILRNSYASLRNIDPAIIEAAKGMGMDRKQITRKIELPLALPVIMAGIRVSTIINVGTAELVFLVSGKGLGRVTFEGVFGQEPLLILQGAAPTAAMAIILGFILERIESRMTPRGLKVGA